MYRTLSLFIPKGMPSVNEADVSLCLSKKISGVSFFVALLDVCGVHGATVGKPNERVKVTRNGFEAYTNIQSFTLY